MYWNVWSIERVLILFVSLAFLLIGFQVTMSHYRQNFHHKSMWIPVIATPLFFIVGFILVFYNAHWFRNLFMILMWVGACAGLLGFYYHFRGVGLRVGGRVFRNFLIGPPIILPLLITAMSTLGLIAIYWRT
jgi:hypothetical protein